MDAAATISRVDAIQQMIATLVTPPIQAATNSKSGGVAAPSSTTPTSFADQLQSASAATATTPAATAAPAATTASTLPASVPFADQITAAASRYGLDPALLAGLVKQESGFQPAIRSSAGAVGLTQLMPGTASSLGVTDPTDPAQSLDGGAKYLREQLDAFGGDVTKALAAYNAGPGAVQKFGGVPPYAETQNYVKAVMANADQYRGATTTA
jgi:soluble lytic murein transglycosylase-like protein